jgi:surface antigen
MLKPISNALFAMIIAASAIASILPQPVQAEQFCQCVRYVKNVLGISQPMGNAKDMINSLPQHGFRQVSDPQSGDIVVMDSAFPGADRTYGHVGFVDSIQNGRVVVRGGMARAVSV